MSSKMMGAKISQIQNFIDRKKCYFDKDLRHLLKKHSKTNIKNLDYSTFGETANKSDIFSIGLIILEMASLQIESDFYDYNAQDIKYKLICSKLSYV